MTKLHFLGTTGYHPNNTRQTACLMLPELGIILDAGTGIFRARDLISTKQLSIFLTHAHLDHSIGVTFLFDILWNKQVNLVQVFGEAEKLKAIDDHLFSPLLFPIKPPCDFRALKQPKMELAGGATLSWTSLEHPGGSIGYKIEVGGKSMAYITDTTASPTSKYIEFIRGVDLLIHECYFPDGYEDRADLTGHSCTTSVATVAKMAQAKELYLVHINPLDESPDPIGIDKAKAIFPNVKVAYDQLVIDF